MKKIAIYLVLALSLLTALYSSFVGYALYRNGYFGFHDVGLINDWFSNALKGRPFFVTEGGFYHLGKHFTPSLLILLPAYALFESQAVLLILGAVAFGWTLFELFCFALQYQRTRWKTIDFSPAAFLSLLALLLFLEFNIFHKAALLSGHFEIFFIPLAILLARLFISRSHPLPFYLTLILAAGIRQDATLFLGALLAGLMLHLGLPRDLWKRLGISALVLGGWLVLAMKVLMPLFGQDQNVSLWASWGSSWAEIIMHMVQNPQQVYDRVLISGLMPLLSSQLYLCLGAPFSFALSHLPGLLLYTMDADARRLLWWYNGTFLLPSCLIFACITGLQINRVLSHLPWSLRSLMQAAAAVYLLLQTWETLPWIHDKIPQPLFSYVLRADRPNLPREIHSLMHACPRKLTVAADFVSSIYLPLRFNKVLLPHFAQSDLVLFEKESHPLFMGIDKDSLYRESQAQGFAPVETGFDGIEVLARPQALACLQRVSGPVARR